MKRAYGGVVIDEGGRVLLRKPTGGFGGYSWTFPKGGADPGESPEQAALREVLEETGYEAKIIAQLPADFVGTTSTTRYWVMEPVRRVGGHDAETESLRWGSIDDARALIAETPSKAGRARDLAVLAAAQAWLRSSKGPR